MIEKINKIRKAVKENMPLIHCITNPISINQCANAVLAIGARPIMAEHPEEVSEITASSKALMLNLGNITDVRIEAMKISIDTAKKNKISVLLDLVGIACSDLRKRFALSLIEKNCPDIIKGNYSEIYALYNAEYKSTGVDSENAPTEKEMCNAVTELSKKYNTVILASGKIDIVTDGEKIALIKNGTEMLSRVTGTGCMLGVLGAGFLSEGSAYDAAVSACIVQGISGELSSYEEGSGSFMVKLLDNLSLISDDDIEKYIKTEEKKIEKI